jgi:glycosyltransferase involved in cell wall biosynthesis
MTKLISIVTPCFNEEGNVDELYARIAKVMSVLPYDYEHIFIDNCSTDETVKRIKSIAARDKHVKLIVNARNFGWIRSPYYGILQSSGDACIMISADLQDPPEMINEYIKHWENGYKIVLSVKPESEESSVMFYLRKKYYQFITKISDAPLVHNATGAGLFDRDVIKILMTLDDPYPYFRGIVCEIGYPIALVPFKQPKRERGLSKTSFFALYDVVMLGITKHSKMPLRLMTMFGFVLAMLSFLCAIVFFVAKLFFWSSFQLGLAPILIGMFFFSAIQMILIGLLGEYVIAIYTHVRKLPLVVESERVNFENSRETRNTFSNIENTPDE